MSTKINISLPSLFEAVKPYYPAQDQRQDHPSTAFQRISSPPDLLHDSEEDDGDSLSTSPPLQQHDLDLALPHPRRKSVPHKSPSVIQDAFQASAIDKSVVFQWEPSVFTDPPYPIHPAHHLLSPDAHQEHHHHHAAMDQDLPQLPPLKSKVICGESLLSALRHRVAKARQPELPIKKRHIHTPRRQLTATCISLPPLHQSHPQRITKKTLPIPVASLKKAPSPTPSPALSPVTQDPLPPVFSPPKQRGRKPNPPSNGSAPVRHGSSGRPCRIKGPCQACQETSDGCMRKAFDWPFTTNEEYNDKGKPFVYLCNKCGLRYNKSGGCVCRHCRWVFCKEEKRKAMQYIEEMRKNRPDGHVDMDEDIEGFVCTPKYWSCGRPWKVGWVLNNQHQDHDDDNSSCDTSV
ncbi:hypothetical protein DM01DRAFT_1331452 [Hesseltinella vesiculosa]|uniref:Uncharacterized protein n=1 Tax=Hesseltinella vesiculosa TaxID=101127 RepID=A0A1X2GVC6_9FUNG|nr:hypothetical protein DM01DRAFT_1331452 [Hesseltinella vesiculosa]